MGRYDWDPKKEGTNIRLHGISFLEAETVVDNPLADSVSDLAHSSVEERCRTIGWSDRGRLLVVVTSEGGPRPRIISARRATKRECDAYPRRR